MVGLLRRKLTLLQIRRNTKFVHLQARRRRITTVAHLEEFFALQVGDEEVFSEKLSDLTRGSTLIPFDFFDGYFCATELGVLKSARVMPIEVRRFLIHSPIDTISVVPLLSIFSLICIPKCTS